MLPSGMCSGTWLVASSGTTVVVFWLDRGGLGLTCYSAGSVATLLILSAGFGV